MEFRDSAQEQDVSQGDPVVPRHGRLPAELARARGVGLFNGSGRRPADYGDHWNPWVKKLNERGWGAPAWPKEHGGGGLSTKEQFILSEEFAWRRAPRPGGIGQLGRAGPTITVVRHRGAEAGAPVRRSSAARSSGASSSASRARGATWRAMQTRAVKDGDDYVINGQKIWTSGAHRADMGILIARTDPDAPKHRGISYFLVDMHTPGITTRPLVNMLNSHEFNEVYFEDARIPASALLGEENRGWYLAATTLDFERSGIATSVAHQLIVRDMTQFAKEGGRESSLDWKRQLRSELAERAIEAQVEALISYRIITMQERGEIPNKESSIAKLFSSELDVRLAVTAMHVSGLYGQLAGHDDPRALSGKLARFYMHSTTSPIGGGTSEIQRNIIATRGLGLPEG
ncbi:MAG: acyl-CoA dehydrogenase family protein [Dehalococcoidia bacterium]|nr:acyl-CoA dehydrogenase family protein [Dehalococcoidia bacterium]